MRSTALAWTVAVTMLSLAGACSDDANADANADTNDGGTNAANGGGKTDAGAPTWHADIAPIVTQKCSGCHRDGGIAPFSMQSYESTKPFASLMVSAVESGRMPPFLAEETAACTPRLPWRDDIRLTKAELGLLKAWAKAGAPEGDAKKAVKLMPPRPAMLEREDVALKIPEAIMVDGKKDIHTCIVLDPELASDVYVVGRLIHAGNDKVLHHVVSYVITPGNNDDGTPRSKKQLLAALKAEKNVAPGERYDCFGGPGLQTLGTEMLDAWAPGGVPNMAPANSGQPVAKDSLVLLDVHYHPNGQPELDDSTHLGLMFSTARPAFVSRMVLLGNFQKPTSSMFGDATLLQQDGESRAEFMIPANEKDHVEEMTWTWKGLGAGLGLRVYAAGTHMHYVGRDMRVTLENTKPEAGEDDEECLIETPAWNFNWQRGYVYDTDDMTQLPYMNDGDVLHIRCVFDNTMDNEYVRSALDDQGLSAPIDVRLGEDTLDEMCLAAVGIMYPNTSPN